MYKLKIAKGEKVRIKDDRRSGLNFTLEYGKEYPQQLLKRLYEAGFTKYISKSKPKKKEDEGTE